MSGDWGAFLAGLVIGLIAWLGGMPTASAGALGFLIYFIVWATIAKRY